MDESEVIKERFKSAISSAVRAISENFNLDVKFGKDKSSTKNTLNLPKPTWITHKGELITRQRDIYNVIAADTLKENNETIY